MVTYIYACDNCEHKFEVLQSIKEDPLIKCPQCSKNDLYRVITSPSIVFKGSGFYTTDSREYPEGKSLGEVPRKGIDY